MPAMTALRTLMLSNGGRVRVQRDVAGAAATARRSAGSCSCVDGLLEHLGRRGAVALDELLALQDPAARDRRVGVALGDVHESR